jgi:hypothetical protein
VALAGADRAASTWTLDGTGGDSVRSMKARDGGAIDGGVKRSLLGWRLVRRDLRMTDGSTVDDSSSVNSNSVVVELLLI